MHAKKLVINQCNSADIQHAPPTVNMLRMKQLPKKVGICRTRLHELIKQGIFPPGISWCGLRSKAWVESEIDQWLAEQVVAARTQSHYK
jgi:predicted DNA-binding transcriptional regulator AlpA